MSFAMATEVQRISSPIRCKVDFTTAKNNTNTFESVKDKENIDLEFVVREAPVLQSRFLSVANLSLDSSDKVLYKLFETYGPVRSFDATALKEKGILSVSYYDLRHASLALKDLNGKCLSEKILSINYCQSEMGRITDEQGRILVSVESHLKTSELFHIFSAYGCVRTIQDLPNQASQKIVEFFDLRSANCAIEALSCEAEVVEDDILPVAITIADFQNRYKLPILIPQREVNINASLIESNQKGLMSSPKSLPSFNISEDLIKSNSKSFKQNTNLTSSSKSYSSLISAGIGLEDCKGSWPCQPIRSLSGSDSVSSFERQNMHLLNFKSGFDDYSYGTAILPPPYSNQLLKPTTMDSSLYGGVEDNKINYNTLLFNSSQSLFSQVSSNSSGLVSMSGMCTSEFPLSCPIAVDELTGSDSNVENDLGIGGSIKDDLPKVLGLYDDEDVSVSELPLKEVSSAGDRSFIEGDVDFNQRNFNQGNWPTYPLQPMLSLDSSDYKDSLHDSRFASYCGMHNNGFIGQEHNYDIGNFQQNITIGYNNNNNRNFAFYNQTGGMMPPLPQSPYSGTAYPSHEVLLAQYLQSLNQAALLQQAVGMEVLKRLTESSGSFSANSGSSEGNEGEESLGKKILRTIWETSDRQGCRRKGTKFGRRTGDRSFSNNEKKMQQEKMFAMDLDRIRSGQDKRTTLMIKNIPNKYTQRMLLARIEGDYKGTFDFFYLPIDFKNKCNVGYGFINMNKPENIVRFVENMHEQRWDKFNSEKVCCVTYARIQGRTALINHFQNSSLMLEDAKHQPLLFGADGEPEPFPTEPIT